MLLQFRRKVVPHVRWCRGEKPALNAYASTG